MNFRRLLCARSLHHVNDRVLWWFNGPLQSFVMIPRTIRASSDSSVFYEVFHLASLLWYLQLIVSLQFFMNCAIFCDWTPCAQSLFQLNDFSRFPSAKYLITSWNHMKAPLFRFVDASCHWQSSDCFYTYLPAPECMGYIFMPGESSEFSKVTFLNELSDATPISEHLGSRLWYRVHYCCYIRGHKVVPTFQGASNQ